MIGQGRTIGAFLFAPLVPCLVFATYMLGAAILFGKPEDMPVVLMGLPFWFLVAMPVSYVAALVLGVPAHWLYRKLRIVARNAYLLGGSTVGLLVGILVVLVFWPSQLIQNWSLLVASILGGVGAAWVFWNMAVRPPNHGFQGTSPLTQRRP
jgi:hypothetical protein